MCSAHYNSLWGVLRTFPLWEVRLPEVRGHLRDGAAEGNLVVGSHLLLNCSPGSRSHKFPPAGLRWPAPARGKRPSPEFTGARSGAGKVLLEAKQQEGSGDGVWWAACFPHLVQGAWAARGGLRIEMYRKKERERWISAVQVKAGAKCQKRARWIWRHSDFLEFVQGNSWEGEEVKALQKYQPGFCCCCRCNVPDVQKHKFFCKSNIMISWNHLELRLVPNLHESGARRTF